MKFLTERTEIAKAINFNKYPVLRINMENDEGYGSNFAVGDKARVKYNCNGKIYYYKCTIKYSDGKYYLNGNGSMIKSDFGYSDVMEMVDYSYSPIIESNQTVILVEDYPSIKKCSVRYMKTDKRIYSNCIEMLRLYEIEED